MADDRHRADNDRDRPGPAGGPAARRPGPRLLPVQRAYPDPVVLPAWSTPRHQPVELGKTGRKAAHRLLATALSRHAFAQAVTIMAFEEVLDLDEHGRLGRHSDGYHVAVFGDPGDNPWAWRFEGHHLSVSATIVAGQPVVAPADIVTRMAVTADALRPAGIMASRLPARQRGQLSELLDIYLQRLAPDLASAERQQISGDDVVFAWAGGLRAGDGHYYRLQAPGLLIEYDNTQRNANHAHTVLRRPGRDFGGSPLASHLAAGHS